MAVTSTQYNPDVRANVSTGRYLTDATAAAFNLEVGFTPRYVKVVNVTSGDQMEWFAGMTNGHGVKTVAAGTRSIVTSNGISVSGKTITVGLDTDVNVINEQITWLAMG